MAAAKDYRTLVNNAVQFSGASLDSLTTTTFGTTTDALLLDFKQWVLQAYREIQMERQSWENTTKNVFKPIRPRLHVNTTVTPQPTLANDPQFDYVLGQESEALVAFVNVSRDTTSVATDALALGLWDDAAPAAFDGMIEFNLVEDYGSNFKFGENFDRANSTAVVQTANWGAVVGWGRYDLKNAYLQRNTTYSVFEPLHSTFYLAQGTEDQASYSDIYDNDDTVRNTPIVFLPWGTWVSLGFEEHTSGERGEPKYITETPEGLYDFYPRPDTEYRLRYHAQMAIDELSAHGDTPDNLPNDYHDAIVWRAVMYYAEARRKPELFTSSSRRYHFYKHRMEDLLMPQVTWGPNRIY